MNNIRAKVAEEKRQEEIKEFTEEELSNVIFKLYARCKINYLNGSEQHCLSRRMVNKKRNLLEKK